MDYTIFAQSIARVKALETKILTRGKLESMIDVNDFAECIKMMQDNPYAGYVSMPSYEEGLKLALEDLYKYMYKIVPVREVIDVLAVRYDGHNIKSLLKGKYARVDISKILISAGTIPVDQLKIMITEENYKNMPETVRNCIMQAETTFKNSQDPQSIDIIIDKGIYKYALEIAVKSQMEYLTEFIKFYIDVLNIKTFIRLKSQDRIVELLEKVFIDGGNLSYSIFADYMNDPLEKFANKIIYTKYSKWGSDGISQYLRNEDPGSIEKFSDNYILSYIKQTKFVNLGPEPLIAYIIAKEEEIKALRIILTGKKNNVNPDTIRERLRDVYV